MSDKEKAVADLEQALKSATDGMSQIEKALFLVKAFREACGGEWRIEACVDGFIVRRIQER